MRTKKQAETPTMRARELRLMANRMRRSGEEELAQQLDKRAAVLLLSGDDADGQQAAARAWLDVFNEAVRLHQNLWTAEDGAVGYGAEWIGARGTDAYIGLYPAWVRRFLREHGHSEAVISTWKRDRWIVVDAEGNPGMLTMGATGRQRMIRLRRDVLAEVQAIADGSQK